LFAGICVHGVGLPLQVVEPLDHEQPNSSLQVVELRFVEQALGVPLQRPLLVL
jgi:hypothetical protein